MAAFGLKSGLIVVADLRSKLKLRLIIINKITIFLETGKILYNLRGHSKAVISLAWCPAPVNIFPIKPLNRVTEKHTEIETVQEQELACDEGERVSKRKQKTPCKVPVSFTEKECPPLDKEIFRRSAITKSEHTQDGSNLQRKSKREMFRVSDILPRRDGLMDIVDVPGALDESSQKNDTPTNQNIIPMDISHSTEKIEPKILVSINSGELIDTKNVPVALEESSQKNDTPTNRDVIDMDISYSTQKIKPKIQETPQLMDTSENLKVFASSSSEDRSFSTASSCDNELNCSKRYLIAWSSFSIN